MELPMNLSKFGSRNALIALAVIILLFCALAWYWSREPAIFDVQAQAESYAEKESLTVVTGVVTTATLIEVANTLLEKPGGYLSNDVTPPSVFLDNMPNWEFGVLVQVRDLARVLRNNISRSQSQSTADPDLEIAEPQFNYNSESWLVPRTEGEYREGIKAMQSYLQRLSDPGERQAQFYARADNLSEWLKMVEVRLGSLSQRLSASVGQERINTDLAGEPDATQSTATPHNLMIKTAWNKIDDEFYEARGSCWALIHFMRAMEIDFASVLAKKNATISLRQIIRELEATQSQVWSPVILNGSGFGFVANHSLTLASYISRANAAVIDLRSLLAQG
ncbi:MAG: DUF2333 family protein [Gammaproteobacteria bacterium]|nr:DUF2333 family protein [Gammaproteobacteria bacterium]